MMKQKKRINLLNACGWDWLPDRHAAHIKLPAVQDFPDVPVFHVFLH
jgi:hypothetical protein